MTLSAKPVLDTTETSVEISRDENSATITWSITNANSFTHVLVEVCEVVQQQCLGSNVTDVSTPSQISIPGGVAYNFSFDMYDGAELVASEEMVADTRGM